jgi:hypothetical protein
MINPNGCGYPPEVNCSDFEDKYKRPGTLFPCFYSDSYFNEAESRVAVPFYSRDVEMTNLGISLGIPLALVILLSFFLFILLRWKAGVRSRTDLVGDSQEDGPIEAFPSFTRSSKLRDSLG